MDRKEELIDYICKNNKENAVKARQLIEEIVFIENQIDDIKKLPFIKINPKNPLQQKATPAAKLYKELLQQYNNSLKLLLSISGDLSKESEEESPLRQWLKARGNLNAYSRKNNLDA